MTCQPAPTVPASGVLSLVILIALLTPTPATGGVQPSATLLFLPVVAYGSGGLQASSVASADVNGDGNLDVVVANNFSAALTSGSVGVLMGNSDGTLQPEVAYDAGGSVTLSVAVADVNGDGKPDLLVANACSTN